MKCLMYKYDPTAPSNCTVCPCLRTFWIYTAYSHTRRHSALARPTPTAARAARFTSIAIRRGIIRFFIDDMKMKARIDELRPYFVSARVVLHEPVPAAEAPD